MAAEILECVINVSEGRDPHRLAALAGAAGRLLLDRHSDIDHHRSVLTLGGPGADVEDAARSVARRAVEVLDLRTHSGVHPRSGVIDVVPFVALRVEAGRLVDGDPGDAVAARDRFAAWAGSDLGLPSFLYGPVGRETRALPEIRRDARAGLEPAFGPPRPHPTAGAVAVGARPLLVAYNLWLGGPAADLDLARQLARDLRGKGLRTLGLPVAGSVQVSCNLIDPLKVGPGAVYDAVSGALARGAGEGVADGHSDRPGPGAHEAWIERAELVGLIPASVLEAEPPERWSALGLGPSTTIEARLVRAGLDGGRFSAPPAGAGGSSG